MDEQFLLQEFEYIANKLDLTVSELRSIFEGENKSYKNYKNKKTIISLGTQIMRALGLEERLFR